VKKAGPSETATGRPPSFRDDPLHHSSRRSCVLARTMSPLRIAEARSATAFPCFTLRWIPAARAPIYSRTGAPARVRRQRRCVAGCAGRDPLGSSRLRLVVRRRQSSVLRLLSGPLPFQPAWRSGCVRETRVSYGIFATHARAAAHLASVGHTVYPVCMRNNSIPLVYSRVTSSRSFRCYPPPLCLSALCDVGER